jgi:hypothetical protein
MASTGASAVLIEHAFAWRRSAGSSRSCSGREVAVAAAGVSTSDNRLGFLGLEGEQRRHSPSWRLAALLAIQISRQSVASAGTLAGSGACMGGSLEMIELYRVTGHSQSRRSLATGRPGSRWDDASPFCAIWVARGRWATVNTQHVGGSLRDRLGTLPRGLMSWRPTSVAFSRHLRQTS